MSRAVANVFAMWLVGAHGDNTAFLNTRVPTPTSTSCEGEFPSPSGFDTGMNWTFNGKNTSFDGEWCNPNAKKLQQGRDYDFTGNGLQQLDSSNANYTKAFDALACSVANPAWLWGDNGYKVPGYGGINSYAVVQVVKDDFWLYGARAAFGADIDKDVNSPWFVDHKTIAAGPNLDTYQNDLVATCFDWTYWLECRVSKYAAMVVGTGAPRNCSAHMSPSSPGSLNTDGPSCVPDPKTTQPNVTSYCSEDNSHIKEYQNVSRSILQYVMPPITEKDNNIVMCNVCKLDFNNVTKSCETNGIEMTLTPQNWTTSNRKPVPVPGGTPRQCMSVSHLKRR